MDYIDVTPSRLISTATKLEQEAEHLSDQLEDIADAADVLRLKWEGDAQEAFDDRQTLFRVRMAQRQASLVAIASKLRKAGDDYASTDRGCARGLGGQ